MKRMTTGSVRELADPQALLRRTWAEKQLVAINELRAVSDASEQGMSQRKIGVALGLSQTQIHRILRKVESHSEVLETSPNEIIWQAETGRITRTAMLKALKEFEHTAGEHAPDGQDGYLAGTWDQVRRAFFRGLLSENEFESLFNAVRPE